MDLPTGAIDAAPTTKRARIVAAMHADGCRITQDIAADTDDAVHKVNTTLRNLELAGAVRRVGLRQFGPCKPHIVWGLVQESQ